MSTHLRRLLLSAAGVVAACYSTALATPAVTSLIDHHPAAYGYVVAVVAVLSTGWHAWNDDRGPSEPVSAPPAAGAGSTTMQAK